MNKLPNLFIVGAEKAATTFLAHNLARHPEIFAPPIKKPQFFCMDIMSKTISKKKYLGFQKNRRDIHFYKVFIGNKSFYLPLLGKKRLFGF